MRADRRGAVRMGAAQAELEARLDIGLGVVRGAIGDDGGLGARMRAVRVGLARPGLRLVQMHMPIDEAGPDLAPIQVDAVRRRSGRRDRGDAAVGDAQIEPVPDPRRRPEAWHPATRPEPWRYATRSQRAVILESWWHPVCLRLMTGGTMNKLLAELADIPLTTDRALVKQKSRDFFWYSPALNRQLRDCTAQAVISPRNEADVIRVAAACVRHRVPITARGGGTGNYGQAVPLQGGVVLDMTALDTIEWQRPGMLRVGPGRKLIDIDRDTRPEGWELRMHPSTKRSATIGGFVAGGSGGVGSVTWGGLREPGNVAAARIVTMEAEPRIIELREAEAQAVNHAYGTTGLITALEMPLAPAWQWIDLIVAFPTFMDAVRFGYAVALADGIVKKLVYADRLADAGRVPPDPRALPGRAGHPDRDDRRTVCRPRSSPCCPAVIRPARSPSNSPPPKRRARCRSTSSPGTTRPCRC